MKLIYIVGFSTEGNSGKNKATREKANALHSLLPEESFVFISNDIKRKNGIISKLLNVINFDLKVSSKLLSEQNRSVVIQRTGFMPLTTLVQKIKNMKILNEFHADSKDEIPHLKKSKFEKSVLYLLVPFSNLKYKLGDGIIFNHIILKEVFDNKFKRPSIYSYNGADTREFYPENKEIVRKRLNIKKDEKICLFLGSVSLWHGVNYLVDIFNNPLIKKQEDLFLYIVGAKDDVYTQELKSINTNDNIKFIEPVSTEVARDYINASDYCMLPANQVRISPGSPLKLYDYISCGKPIISQSNLRGYSDEVENYKLGYTLDLRNSHESAVGMIKIINEEKDFTKNNREIALTKVNWLNRMEKWVDFAKTINKI